MNRVSLSAAVPGVGGCRGGVADGNSDVPVHWYRAEEPLWETAPQQMIVPGPSISKARRFCGAGVIFWPRCWPAMSRSHPTYQPAMRGPDHGPKDDDSSRRHRILRRLGEEGLRPHSLR